MKILKSGQTWIINNNKEILLTSLDNKAFIEFLENNGFLASAETITLKAVELI